MNKAVKEGLSKGSVVGAVMAVGGVILFVVLYAALTNAGVDRVARILIALCVPPGVMALLIGGYFVVFRPLNKPAPPASEQPEQPE